RADPRGGRRSGLLRDPGGGPAPPGLPRGDRPRLRRSPQGGGRVAAGASGGGCAHARPWGPRARRGAVQRVPEPAGGRAHGVRQHRDGGGGHQARGRPLPHQARGRRRDPGGVLAGGADPGRRARGGAHVPRGRGVGAPAAGPGGLSGQHLRGRAAPRDAPPYAAAQARPAPLRDAPRERPPRGEHRGEKNRRRKKPAEKDRGEGTVGRNRGEKQSGERRRRETAERDGGERRRRKTGRGVGERGGERTVVRGPPAGYVLDLGGRYPSGRDRPSSTDPWGPAGREITLPEGGGSNVGPAGRAVSVLENGSNTTAQGDCAEGTPMIQVKLPDGSARALEEGASAADLAAQIGSGLAKAAVAAKVNGAVRDLALPLRDGDEVSILTKKDPEALEVLRHSAAHLMADAILRVFPQAELTIGPVVEDGFYYDIHMPEGKITPEDFPKIEKEMQAIAQSGVAFQRCVSDGNDEIFARYRAIDGGNNKFKAEIIEGLKGGDVEMSFYKHGDFIDLCRGPHVPSTSFLK